MDNVHADRYARAIVVGLIFALLTMGASACGLWPGSDQSAPDTIEYYESDDDCVKSAFSGVESVGMAEDGTVLYLSSKRPSTLPEGQSWSSGEDRAVYVVRDPQEVTASEIVTEPYTAAIVIPWEIPESDVIQGINLDENGRPITTPPPKDAVFPEQMIDLQVARTGGRFVLSVRRGQTTAGFAKLYSGMVPPDDRVLSPAGGGLEVVPINDFAATEGVFKYLLSPDGTKLAVTAAPLGELRIFDFTSGQPIIYTMDDGDTVVSNELPPPATSIGVNRQAAITLPGASRMAWSPDGSTLAVANTDSVGVTGVWLIDLATGDYDLVRRFEETTVPFVQWTADGQSLFVLNTRLTNEAGSSFGNSQVRRIEAREDGKDIGDAWQLEQLPYYRTAPADLTGFGDDALFAFTWEGQLWMLFTPASGTGSAQYVPITDESPDMTSNPGNLAGVIGTSKTNDMVTFATLMGGSNRVGWRLAASAAPGCPLAPPPESADGEASGEGEAAEGDAASDTADESTGEGAADGGEAEESSEGQDGESTEGETEGQSEGEESDEG